MPRLPDALLNKVAMDAASGCWLWTGAKNNRGYGHLRYHGRLILAHRLAFQTHYGFLGQDEDVCHRCDTPGCVNPAHLFASDARGNAADMVSKGRHRAVLLTGELHTKAKLTLADIDEIRRLCRSGLPQRTVAAQFGTTQANVSLIIRGKAWRHGNARLVVAAG